MKYADGWLTIPFDGSDWARVTISVGGVELPAFFGFEDGQRVIKIRPDKTGSVRVRSSVNGSVFDHGRIKI